MNKEGIICLGWKKNYFGYIIEVVIMDVFCEFDYLFFYGLFYLGSWVRGIEYFVKFKFKCRLNNLVMIIGVI